MKFLFVILAFLLLQSQTKIPNDTVKIGRGSSTAKKGFLFGKGANSGSILFNQTNRRFDMGGLGLTIGLGNKSQEYGLFFNTGEGEELGFKYDNALDRLLLKDRPGQQFTPLDSLFHRVELGATLNKNEQLFNSSLAASQEGTTWIGTGRSILPLVRVYANFFPEQQGASGSFENFFSTWPRDGINTGKNGETRYYADPGKSAFVGRPYFFDGNFRILNAPAVWYSRVVDFGDRRFLSTGGITLTTASDWQILQHPSTNATIGRIITGIGTSSIALRIGNADIYENVRAFRDPTIRIWKNGETVPAFIRSDANGTFLTLVSTEDLGILNFFVNDTPLEFVKTTSNPTGIIINDENNNIYEYTANLGTSIFRSSSSSITIRPLQSNIRIQFQKGLTIGKGLLTNAYRKIIAFDYQNNSPEEKNLLAFVAPGTLKIFPILKLNENGLNLVVGDGKGDATETKILHKPLRGNKGTGFCSFANNQSCTYSMPNNFADKQISINLYTRMISGGTVLPEQMSSPSVDMRKATEVQTLSNSTIFESISSGGVLTTGTASIVLNWNKASNLLTLTTTSHNGADPELQVALSYEELTPFNANNQNLLVPINHNSTRLDRPNRIVMAIFREKEEAHLTDPFLRVKIFVNGRPFEASLNKKFSSFLQSFERPSFGTTNGTYISNIQVYEYEDDYISYVDDPADGLTSEMAQNVDAWLGMFRKTKQTFDIAGTIKQNGGFVVSGSGHNNGPRRIFSCLIARDRVVTRGGYSCEDWISSIGLSGNRRNVTFVQGLFMHDPYCYVNAFGSKFRQPEIQGLSPTMLGYEVAANAGGESPASFQAAVFLLCLGITN